MRVDYVSGTIISAEDEVVKDNLDKNPALRELLRILSVYPGKCIHAGLICPMPQQIYKRDPTVLCSTAQLSSATNILVSGLRVDLSR